MSYLHLKHLHVATVWISIVLFVGRYLLLQLKPEQPLPRVLKILPHVNDTVLLLAAIGLLVVANIRLFDAPWVLAKLAALIIYIVVGAKCLRSVPRTSRQASFFAVSIVLFGYIVAVATTKQVFPI